MPKINVSNLIEEAHEYFSVGAYDKAIFLYAQASSLEPKNLEYQIYALFCDIASEDVSKAQSLFDYFIVQKDIDFQKAVSFVQESISAYDGDVELMMKLLHDISEQNIETLDAIEYGDFLKLVQTRGSFREAYEDIMFSTKVAITSKEDLIDFINMLIENNFNTTAYSYLDGYGDVFAYDDELVALYSKLGEKSIENSKEQ